MSLSIKLYTITGCASCKIIEKNINEVINNNASLNIKITTELVDEKHISDVLKHLKRYKIYDFPAFQFIRNGVIILSDYGSRPVAVLQRYIDLYFK